MLIPSSFFGWKQILNKLSSISAQSYSQTLSSVSATSIASSSFNAKPLAPVFTAAAKHGSMVAEQKYDFLLITDFEATCDANRPMVPQEIIEFPCLKFNTKTLTVDSTFHRYVRPNVHAILTPFCTELTGIVQSMVETQPNLVEVLAEFDQWLIGENLKQSSDDSQNRPIFTHAFVTCGEWDFKTLLSRQCEYLGVVMPSYFRYWINIKKPFFKHAKIFPKGMMHMLELLQVPHVGKHHSGIDDVKNVANIAKALCERGVVFELTSKI